MENNENNLNQSGVDTNLNTTPVGPAVNTQPSEPIPNPFGIPNIEPQPVQPAPQEKIEISFGEPSVAQPVQNIEVFQSVEPTPVADPVQNAEPTPVVEPVQSFEQPIQPTTLNAEPVTIVESNPSVQQNPAMESVQNVEPVVVTQPTVETVEPTQPVMEPVPELDPQQPSSAPEPVQNNDDDEKPKKKGKGGLIFLIFLLLVAALASVYFFVFDGDINNILKGKDKTTEVENKEVTSTYRMTDNKLCDFDLSFMKLENDGKNKVYSPISIKYALAMLKDGANGESKSQIEDIIGDYKSKKYVDSQNMSFANAMFIRDTFKDGVKQTYTDTLKEKYNADVIYDSFASASPMNKWISDKTFNLINNMLDDVSAKNFILINALAIDMEWVNKIQSVRDDYSVKFANEKFSKAVSSLSTVYYHNLEFNNKTQNSKSVEIGAVANKYDIVNKLGKDKITETLKNAYSDWLANGAVGSCDGKEKEPDADTYIKENIDKYISDLNSNYKHVSSSTDFEFYDDDNLKAFAKDLKEYNGTTLQYIGIMPKKDSLSDYVKNTSAKDLNSVIDSLKQIKLDSFDEDTITEIKGYIPMFKFEADLDLTSNLPKIGITDVFNEEKADLSNLTSAKGTYIADAKQKANIEFSNDGIKASAATALGGKGAAGCGFSYSFEVPVKVIDLTFDKPYMFIIRDKQTGEVWFAGTVYEPIKYEPYKE